MDLPGNICNMNLAQCHHPYLYSLRRFRSDCIEVMCAAGDEPSELSARIRYNYPAKLIAYFKDSDGDHAEFALVHYYDGQRVPHPDLGVLVMSLMQPSLADAYGVVTLENIAGHARMIRDRTTQYYFWDLVE